MNAGLEALLAREACARLCVDFAGHADAREADRLALLFTSDGEFDRLGQVFKGREAIRNAIAARPEDVWTRHYVSNIRIDVGPDGLAARGVCHLLLFRGKTGTAGHEVIHAEYEDVFVRAEEGWQIASRKVIGRP